MSSVAAFIAAHRFGFGPRPGELERISPDPRGWVLAQIDPAAPVPASLTGFPSSGERLRAIFEAAGPRGAAGAKSLEIAKSVSTPEIVAQLGERVRSERPLIERLVAFWSNHFATARNKSYNHAIGSTFATEAIRPHIFGSFADMLFAAETHPAMQTYLDNNLSIGPNSPIGQRLQRTDINENLAREMLELHTLGVDGGYSQADVEALALILTGWSVPNRRYQAMRERMAMRSGMRPFETFGPATYFFQYHEPGRKRLLGKTYRENGPEELREVTRDLTAHPATARHLATKLVRHFVADTPPEPAVAAVASVFAATGGDLAEVTRSLVGLEAAWADPLPKFKTPQDYVVAALRALDVKGLETRQVYSSLPPMGQEPLRYPSPKGWPDTAAAWVSPGGLMRRIEFARIVARRVGDRMPPLELLEATCGPVAGAQTRALVSGAPSGEEGVAFVLASREFQRR